jgi:hypothetical protein
VALTSRRHGKIVSLLQSIGWGELIMPLDDGGDTAARVLRLIEQRDTLAARLQRDYVALGEQVRACIGDMIG